MRLGITSLVVVISFVFLLYHLFLHGRHLVKRMGQKPIQSSVNAWKDIVVILNAGRKAVSVDVPEGTYTAVVRDGEVNEHGLGTLLGPELTVSPESALIVFQAD